MFKYILLLFLVSCSSYRIEIKGDFKNEDSFIKNDSGKKIPITVRKSKKREIILYKDNKIIDKRNSFEFIKLSSKAKENSSSFIYALESFLLLEDPKKQANLIYSVWNQSSIEVDLMDTVIIGTGRGPLENPYFSEEIIDMYQKFFNHNVSTLYGYGKNSTDTLISIKKKDFFKKSNINKTGSFNSKNSKKLNKKLIIIAGHGTKKGLPIWGQGGSKNAFLSYKTKSLKDSIVISGTCFGGKFATAVACGYFAAHPEVTSTGCWTESKDEPHYLKSVLEAQIFGDFNQDGKVSLEEAHWYALMTGNQQDILYSSYDEKANSIKKIKKTISLAELNELVYKIGTVEERLFLESTKLPEVIHLNRDIYDFSIKVCKTKLDCIEYSNKKRIEQFARRMIYRKNNPKDIPCGRNIFLNN
jgi:hypothetical protein